MKKLPIILAMLLVSRAFAQTDEDPDLNDHNDRFTLSARFGFNIRAGFSKRLTPDGSHYNYLDGYMLPDSTGDFDPTSTFPGITQNWGYDNSARQRDASAPIAGFPTVSMTRLASGADPFAKSMADDPALGAELVYSRRLMVRDKWHFGVEGAINFMNVCLNENGTTSGNGVQDSYQYFPGTSPPDSPTANGQPYQGTFNGPGIVISDTPAGSTTVPVTVDAQRNFEANVWGFRLGPYMERQLGRRVAVNLVGGLAFAIVNGTTSWRETLTVNGVTDPTLSGSGSSSDVLWGYYLGANVACHLSRRWDVNAGVQYQNLGVYRQDSGDREAELDLCQSIFVNIGVNWKF